MNETNPSQAQDLAKSILVNEEETNQTAVEEVPAIDEPVEDIGTGDDTNVDSTEDQGSIEIEEPQEEAEPLYDVKVDGEFQKWTLSQLQQSAAGQGYLNKRMQETASIRKQAEDAYQQVQKQRSELDTKLREYTAQFNNVDLEEETYRSTYKMQKINQLKKSSDTLKTKFQEDINMFSESFIIGHSLKKLPNLNPNQIQLEDDYVDGSFLKLLDSPEVYEINGVLSIAEDEVDSYFCLLYTSDAADE